MYFQNEEKHFYELLSFTSAVESDLIYCCSYQFQRRLDITPLKKHENMRC